ncbi:hypothetical protein F4781DRAFT_438759 [Annulohypoxylon bovei var. microspora]|nr:hypothetical protein F4781DRAFT_438759 [Annulohypoxylon bovei var. microspora]
MSSPMTRIRVANACDICKQRKVKCDGNLPCRYCSSRQGNVTCRFSPTARRRVRRPHLPSPESTAAQSSVPSSARPEVSPDIPAAPSVESSRTSGDLTHHSDVSAEEEADVPREARLLCDARGKLTFVGDCAPLSLYQTVRQIVASRVDPNAFTPRTSRVSMLENASSDPLLPGNDEEPYVDPADVQRLVSVFISVTSGLVDLFERADLVNNISIWASEKDCPKDAASAVNYLVLAIGSQSVDEGSAARYFQYAKTLALSCLGGDLGTETVQAFALVTLYMLRACQINGAFLFFGIAARAAYSIGLHRTEVNYRFGPEFHTRRDRLWKSLRVLDLFLSISMGRPPSMSDIDCTVPCGDLDANGQEKFDLLNASVQILSITEDIVLQVYSRRKISLQLTEGISCQLRDWSRMWLSRLKRTIAGLPQEDRPDAIGACQVMSCYYYAVMLVARPFLMYELCKRLPENTAAADPPSSGSDNSGRTRLANACIDAASLMAESVLDLVDRQLLDGRMPLIVSWLFASSLVLGVGLLGGFGRILEKYAHMSIAALEHFSKNDAHAMQYTLIAKSLLSSALEYLQRRDVDERLRITESSSQLFGLIPKEHLRQDHVPTNTAESTVASGPQDTNVPHNSLEHESLISPFHDIDPILLSLGCSLDSNPGASFSNEDQQDQTDQVFGALNLFPLLDGNGHIDLAHYF